MTDNAPVNTPLPQNIGPYRVLRPIARGGMAEVYEVEERASGEHQALKLLVQTGGALDRFNREYEAMIRLNHPNIVRVYNYGLFGALPWLTMELVEGTPIQAFAKRCGRPGTDERTQEVIRVAHDLALALEHIHHRGLVHRDLKSANVLVLPDGRVKLLDFGTARVSDPIQAITRDGEFIGTFAYASPEQLLNQPIGPTADLYSFGVLLFRLATGRRPFDAKEVHDLARQHVRQLPPAPRSVVPTVPVGLEEIILALLEKRPEDRPQSGAEVANALEAVAGHALYLPGTLDVDMSGERLVGREQQLRQLWEFLAGAGGGHPSEPSEAGDLSDGVGSQPADMALVVGLQGAGRHRVMQVMEREVDNRGWRGVNLFFRRGAEDLDQFTGMLASLGRTFGVAASTVAMDLVQQIRHMERASSLSVAERLEVLRAAGAALIAERSRLDSQPIVLLVRGLQHAGPVGFEALVGLREKIRALRTPVLLLADCTENADDPHSMAQKRLPDAMRVALPPMSVRQVALLVGSLLNRRPPPAAVARQIYRASGGLPTYVEEVVKGLVAGGILRVRSRDVNRIEWAQRDDIEIPVPSGAQDRVIDSLCTLPADRRRCLEVLALCGGEGSVKVLAGALQCHAVELMPALEDLANRGWISLQKLRRVPYARWRQILAEQVVLDQLNPCRRVVLERLIIDQVAHEPAFVAQIRLLLEVGRVEEALERGRDWALHHIARNKPMTALEVLDIVVPAVDGAEGLPSQLRSQLYLAHVNCLLMARPTDPQTNRSLTKADRLAEVGGLFTAEMHLTRARIQRVIGHYPNFRKQLMEAWYQVEHAAPTALGATVATMLGWSNRVGGHVDDAATWHGRARRIAVQTEIGAVRAHADVGVAGWQYARGLLIETERTVAAAIDVFGGVDDISGLSEALPSWADSLRQQGRLTEVLQVLYDQLPVMRESEAPTFYVRLLLANAWCEVALGRLGRAQECVDELAATLRRGEHLHLRLQADLVWGRILLASGLNDDAAHRLQHVAERAGAAGLHVIEGVAKALEAEAMWALGEQRSAMVGFTAAVKRLESTGDVPATAEACRSQARAMCESVDPDRVFRPVAHWMETQPAVLCTMELQVARARYLHAMGRDARPVREQAEDMLARIAEKLDDTDASALRLHPWTQWLRRLRLAQTGG